MKPIFLKLSTVILLFAFISAGCQKEAPPPCACGVENPQENLEWLNHILQKSFYTEIYSIQYKGNEYIGVYDRPKTPDAGAVIYDCEGNKFCAYIGISGKWTCNDINTPEFISALENKILLYIQESNPYWDNKE